jgi:hypothetical protein
VSAARPIWARGAALVTTIVLMATCADTLAAQCAMCRTLLATPEGERIATALRSGIWILLAAPFGAFAVIAAAAIRSRKRYLSTYFRHSPEP